MYMYGWFSLLFPWNYHNIVNWLHPKTKSLKNTLFLKGKKLSLLYLIYTENYYKLIILNFKCSIIWKAYLLQGIHKILCKISYTSVFCLLLEFIPILFPPKITSRSSIIKQLTSDSSSRVNPWFLFVPFCEINYNSHHIKSGKDM